MPTNYWKLKLFSSKIKNPRFQMPPKKPYIAKPRNWMSSKFNETTVPYHHSEHFYRLFKITLTNCEVITKLQPFDLWLWPLTKSQVSPLWYAYSSEWTFFPRNIKTMTMTYKFIAQKGYKIPTVDTWSLSVTLIFYSLS